MRLPNPQITLADAVRVTVQNNPEIARSSQDVQLAVGRVQQSRGFFDLVFSVSPSATYTVQQAAPSLIKGERDKRTIILEIGKEFTTLTTAFNRIVANGSAQPPRCPTNLTLRFAGLNFSNEFLSSPVSVDRVDANELTLLGTETNLPGSPFSGILEGVTLGSLCTSPAVVTLTPEALIDVFRDLAPKIDQSGGLGLEGLLRSVSQIPRESRALQAQITHAIATRAFLALERLGPVPIDQLRRTFLTDVSLSKPLRNGISFAGTFQLQMQNQNFRDKSYDSSFGGMGVPPNFGADLSGTISVPVGRNAGSTAVAAPERSAALAATGRRAALGFEVSQQAYRTALSYLNLVAAQETLEALLESVTRQQRIVELTKGGVTAGDLPSVEVGRAQARAERVNSAVSDARSAVVAARVGLADTIGISADDLAATPLATEDFAQTYATAQPVDALVTRALTARLDVRAADAQRAAADTLAAGARANQRRRFDFLVTGGISNIYDSPTYKFLPDEVNPIIPPSPPLEDALHYYSWRGFYRAIQKRWEPYVVAQLSIEMPFGNHTAKGRFQQAQATATTSRINAEDLTRRIRLNIVDASHQLERSLASLQQWEAAVRNDEEILAGSLQRFQARDVTLVDTLLTEESVTSDRLELVRQRQTYFSTLARLRFEAGELVDFGSAEAGPESYRFDPSMFVSRVSR